MSEIALARGLRLPIEAVTQTFGILAMRGKGKTNTAVVMTEEMINAGQQVVVVDPVGVWWGLRGSASGTDTGLPVVIFGGDHADVPLEETAGELIADVVIESQMSVVIDLSHLRKGAMRRFMTDFLERLYYKNREALHVILDEADSFAPQRAQAEGARLLGAVEDLVRRGRARGLGCTLITQRPAVINKDVLTQIEVLIVLGMVGPQDIKAIDDWTSQHADVEEARKVKGTLPGLEVGEAWVWSPSWLGILKRVRIRARNTFDSSATPKPGQKRKEPKRIAEVDLAALGERIQASVEKQKQEDPKALRARIRALEVEVDKALEGWGAERAQLQEEIETLREKRVVPAVTPEIMAVFDRQAPVLGDLLRSTSELLSNVQTGLMLAAANPDGRSKKAPVPTPRSAPAQAPPRARRPAGGVAVAQRQVVASGVKIGKTERNVLSVLVQHGPCSPGMTNLMAGYSNKASTLSVALGKLRRAGLAEEGQPLRATQMGVDFLGDDVEPLPTGQALVEFWRNRFGKTERNVLDALLALHPHPGTLDDVAGLTGYSRDASTISVALGKLRKVGVIAGWALSDEFLQATGL